MTENRRQKTKDRGEVVKNLIGKKEKTSLLHLFTSSPIHLFKMSLALALILASPVFAEELNLQQLIDEALKNSHEILITESRTAASKFKIPQAESLPDPMVMFGYQNGGFRKLYNFSGSPDSRWMFSASQTFPFPGKLSLKGEIASRDAESQKALSESVRLKTIARVKELYYELFLAYKNIDLIKEKTTLFSRIEDAALSRYSTGMAPQQEVLMAQTEKYMLLEKEEMLRQKIQSIEAMLNATIGRDVNSPLGRPAELPYTMLQQNMEGLINLAYANSPEIMVKEKIIAGAEAKVQIARKEYYPDFTINGSYFLRNKEVPDMWSLTATINIPIFYKTKQKQAVNEAEASLSEARHELESTRIMLSSAIRDNYSMIKTAEKLMELYKNGLIPKTYQDFELSLSGYITGKIDALTVISRLKSFIELETLYWNQFVEREKAIARVEAIAGISIKREESKK
ncbi:PTS cellobiose transporter subunit IIC [Dissulfurispira thermophila]|uniref:PTS cellobiose transporter subunit IIC n=2 Tax=root TaxID=1 RepID=A0A7G1H1A3_9BACT|nr:TolC family protein [Dissulfurispira thermophila]BCB95923.1 PTS cellobiose transporter subunit IIC [Dissulfurispira thermophila]